MWDISLILRNRVLIAAVAAWFIAQAIKFALALVLEKKVDFVRLIFGSGGMPSSHSALVTALSAAMGAAYGFDTGLFAISACFSMVVMTDAAGVRRSAGEIAASVNKIVKHLMEDGVKGISQEELKELIGHTPLEVIAGAVLGVVTAVIII